MEINLTDIITAEQIDEAKRMGACKEGIRRFRRKRKKPLRWCDLTEEEMCWCLSQDPELTAALLDAGVDATKYSGALLGAAEAGRTEVVKLLLKAGVDVHTADDYALTASAEHGHIKVVKILLKAGANVQAGEDLPLRLAAFRGHIKVVKILLEAGADVNVLRKVITRMWCRDSELNKVWKEWA